MKLWKVYVMHMLEAIRKIEKYVNRFSLEEFLENNMVKDAVLRNIEIIGEAARNIPEEIKNKHEEIPWRVIVDTRNRIIHGYFSIDWRIVWDVIKSDIPELKSKLEKMLNEEE